MGLPIHFCWTRFGTHAGEGIEQILVRKEEERQANGGVFLWGIGNSVGPSIRELLRREASPEVVFSPMRSTPRQEDMAPRAVVVWTAARTLSGEAYELPGGSVVTSRVGSAGKDLKIRQYALVCSSSVALRLEEKGDTISFGRLRNLRTGGPLGASQVTTVVRVADSCDEASGVHYAAVMRARLVCPFFIELKEPVLLPPGGSTAETCGRSRQAMLLEFVRRRHNERLRPEPLGLSES